MGEIADALKRASAEREASIAEQAARSSSPSVDTDDGPDPASEAVQQRAVSDGRSQLDVAPEPIEKPLDPPLGDEVETSAKLSDLEHNRHLALRLRSELERHGSQSLAIVSALRNEGKTTVACNVAIALASLMPERSVAIVDLDLRNPSVDRQLSIECTMGVDTLLMGRAKIEEVRVRLDTPALDVFPVVAARRAAHEFLVGPRFAGLIADLESRYAVVIIDTPPTLLLPDSTLILRQGACCAAVARIGQTRVRRYQELLDLLPASQIIGKILNGATPPRHSRDYYYTKAADS